MNRKELELEIQHQDLLDALATAKANYAAAVGKIPAGVKTKIAKAIDDGDVSKAQRLLSDHKSSISTEGLDKAKVDLAAFREKWRTVRSAFLEAGTTAAPETLATAAKGN